MYKRSILDYFHVHEPTNAKKNQNEEPEEDVDCSSVIAIATVM